uniref:Tensin-2-like n=1 Tax=Sparus aurata TaxID=8175 RepID=A0A671XAU2_SPAAU
MTSASLFLLSLCIRVCLWFWQVTIGSLAAHKDCAPHVESSSSKLYPSLFPPPSFTRKTPQSIIFTECLLSLLSTSAYSTHVMECHYDFDLTYITERIISVFFLPDLEEQRYRRNLQEVASMLKSKHQDKFLLLNLSEKRHDITRLNPKVQDYGWPDIHAPPLDKICAICKAMETWLTSDPQNVVVLHCKGNKGKTGVIIAAYMHYSKISAGVDQALTTLAMRKFCEDKVSSSIQPSQNRSDTLVYFCIYSSVIHITLLALSPLFLHQVLIPSLPHFQEGGGFYPFLKIYQSLQLVYTSGVYSRARKLCVTMEPALLLKGDIMVKCYHRRSRAAEREVVFRVQFHTCTVHGAQLWFGKTELDLACTDDRFPPDATVEFIFSNGPEKMKGRDYRKNDASIKVDYNTSDPVVRWDSYENFNLHHQDSMENISHTRGPLDGSLYAQVRKRLKPQTPSQPQPLSDSSRCSVPSDQLEDTSLSINHPQRENTESPSRRRDGEDRAKEKTRGKERDRETAILDDGDPSSPGGLRRQHSCCGRVGSKCGDGGWEREREPCLSNGHCLGCCSSIKKHPKSQTLPALPIKSVSPPPHSTHMELCHRHSAHPLPELPWERPPPPPPLPCLLRPCYPYSSPERSHPHSHTLPASNRLCTGEDCHLFHYSSHSPASHLSHQSLPSSPYREMFFGSPTPSSGCSCRDCSSRREHQSASVRTFHPLLPNQSENAHWSQGAGVQRTREVPPVWESENPWEMAREAEMWQCKPVMPAFRICHSSLDQGPNQELPRYVIGPHQGYPSPQSLMDVRDGASSGYHTPPQPRHSSKIAGSAEVSNQLKTSSYATVIITPVQVQLNGSALPSDTQSDSGRSASMNPSVSLSSSPSTTSPNSPVGSPDIQSSPQRSTSAMGQRLTPDRDSSADTKPPSPVPDGYHTPTFPLASYYYPLLNVPHPPLPEKKRLSNTPGSLNGHNSLLRVTSAPSPTHHVSFSPSAGEQRRGSTQHSSREETDIRVNAKFVQDSSKYWYKPGISRDQAIAVLKDKGPGTFLIRDSNSFQGAYGLALKVATPPPNANIIGDPLEQLVRHFLIETGPRGVKIKGCQNESYFGSLSALVYQHSITPISLPCALRIPEKDLVGELQEMQSATNTSTAADLLKQGAACNVLYLNSVETESLTGPEAVSKATKCTLALSPRPAATVVHFKVSSQGITLTDSKRRLFFRRHYPISSVTFSSLDPQDQRWTNSDSTSSKMFGFVARRTGSATENVCHLFAEMDPEQPAVAIVNFINKVMLGPQLHR